ncbi:uncharacterized protein PpBr36_09942 [Pyricularia pennisetigena]|uniref:uncharacterized protein n=1 Tax=Pyricularia pennisetigena TaxID=1578925 RepID=UPI00114E168C|nr:uncharacterized protein PpBr36_09942 [Pyricularia pennisetigena]TLS22359.1 hypothetical protein PpBr36_09942 [Pyricularia pennisetigena]
MRTPAIRKTGQLGAAIAAVRLLCLCISPLATAILSNAPGLFARVVAAVIPDTYTVLIMAMIRALMHGSDR